MVKVCCNQSTSLLRETHTVQIDDGPLADVWKHGNGAENLASFFSRRKSDSLSFYSTLNWL